MNFASVPAGSRVFLDANTLIYYATAEPTFGIACKQLIERIAFQAIEGFTSALVLTDLAHRAMTIEAMAKFGWPIANVGKRLRQNPTLLQTLTQFRQSVEDVPKLGIHVLPVDETLVVAATIVSQQYGLLTGDALVIATMQRYGLTVLASSDSDFDMVPGIQRYEPL